MIIVSTSRVGFKSSGPGRLSTTSPSRSRYFTRNVSGLYAGVVASTAAAILVRARALPLKADREGGGGRSRGPLVCRLETTDARRRRFAKVAKVLATKVTLDQWRGPLEKLMVSAAARGAVRLAARL